MVLECVCSFDTGLTADSFEKVPLETGNDSVVVSVGTYQYYPEQGERVGRLYLMQLMDIYGLRELCRFDTDGILDCKWNGCMANLALSTGHLQILQASQDLGALIEKAKIEVDPSTIALSLDVQSSGKAIVSCSNGNVGLMDVEAGEVTELWRAHLAEVWCASFDRHDGHLAYSASDDYSFAAWDTRSLHQGPAFQNRFHSAGVCTITSDPNQPYRFATGSYDQQAALWDSRMIKKDPLALFNAESGVWRLRWDPEVPNRLLAACMHDGFYLLETDEESKGIIAKEHVPSASLAYGADWISSDSFGGATFYNHSAMIYKF